MSCVEAGRWDGSRHDESFSPAPQAAYPALRSMKNRAARESVAAGRAPRAVQGAVWDEVAQKAARMDVVSDTGAMHDIYDRHRDRLAEVHAAVRLHDGQTGALVLIDDRPAVLDHVSRPEVFAALHAPLVQGYALDALEAEDSAIARQRTRRRRIASWSGSWTRGSASTTGSAWGGISGSPRRALSARGWSPATSWCS